MYFYFPAHFMCNYQLLFMLFKEYADNLLESGVHGGVLVLEASFNTEAMATALGIPQGKSYVRRHLATELDALIKPARYVLDIG